MLFNKAIAILVIASIKQGTAAATKEEQRLRGMNSIINANNGDVNKYVATNLDGTLPIDEEPIILKDDKPQVKMATQAQIEAFEEEVRKFHDRPIESIPRTEAGTTYGGVDLTDRLKKSKKESSSDTSTETTPFPFHLRSGSKLTDVSCGGHRRDVCANCPVGDDGAWNGQGWCNGDCIWDVASGTCGDATAVVCNVSCGGHCAADCAACPMGNGAGWCNGDCTWDSPTETCIDKPAKVCNADGSITAATCTDCAFADCISGGSSECEPMPAFTSGASPDDCRYVLDNTDARSASTFFNYNVPAGVSKPAWWFNKLDILETSTASFYSTNGHKFGYAGFQVSETNPYQGRVLFSIWDQGGCDQEANANCPAAQVAKTVACGTGIKCTDFGGEGTGRKSIVYSDNLPILDQPYYIVTWARSVGAETYRMQYSTFFFVPGTADWDAAKTETSAYTPTAPGWQFLSTIEVGTDDTQQWYMSGLYSFLEQWTGSNGLARRAGLYGPSFLAGETGDFVQINDCYFRHGEIENYKHVNAFSDAASGSLGMEMGSSVTRTAYNNQLFQFPVTSKPAELDSFIPIKQCLEGLSTSATTAEIEGCLTATATTPTASCLVKKVKIEGTTNQPLNMIEVKVFSNNENVAPQGTASQSTTYANRDDKYGAAKAIDNDPASFTSTAGSSTPAWWQVSLATAVSVQSIKIYNRKCAGTSVCLCRMSKANLNLYDESGEIVYSKNLGDTCGVEEITEAVTC